ncbi:cytochrome c biogenesis protein ResB [Candidatus Methylacidiphilum infernorum]|uniref:ResB protein required for cytochrome c biosynthesis n=1 Tax=Methylacidiphilum infernorum (isolate V4) TaxID=481448 RepID=B3DYQ8_METI4|nr:cytochrome c biogenesis protein ResB [Candidatus Methylacidiphilum infernorum]ACD82430.1 ResB protein required for cytochrome c biosynthesis [Methylacidiphilum infernorum V4]
MRLFSPLSEVERKKLIEERKKSSTFWKIIHLLGSLRLAIFLLLSIAFGCAIATFLESRLDTQVAQFYIYKSPWFFGWLILLCVNLFAVTLTRIPWKKRHLGFIVTHYGIIILLMGALVGLKKGFEGFITLEAGDAPSNRLATKDTVLLVKNPILNEIEEFRFPAELWKPSPKSPRALNIPGTGLKFYADDYARELFLSEDITKEPNSESSGVLIELKSKMANQAVRYVLLKNDPSRGAEDFFGMARLEMKDPSPAEEMSFHESAVLFANAPDQSVIHAHEGVSSNYRYFLLWDNPAVANRSLFVVLIGQDGEKRTWPLNEIIHKTVDLPGEAKMEVAEYWPNFSLKEGKPTSLSGEPLNPAILVHIHWQNDRRANLIFRLWDSPDGIINYQLLRKGKIYQEGQIERDKPLSLGWGDWSATLLKFEPRASIKREIQKIKPAESAVAQLLPSGLHCWIEDKKTKEKTQPLWILSGYPQSFVLDNIPLQISFGFKTITLPFRVSLEKFEVPRNEGSDSPSDFISTLRFEDPQTGKTVIGKAHMNYPASFPGGLWRSVLGLNYKFSQSSWNPQDLNESTLQVLYDPGWPLKWVGSLMICLGILTMFLISPKPPVVLDKDTKSIPKDENSSCQPTTPRSIS